MSEADAIDRTEFDAFIDDTVRLRGAMMVAMSDTVCLICGTDQIQVQHCSWEGGAVCRCRRCRHKFNVSLPRPSPPQAHVESQ